MNVTELNTELLVPSLFNAERSARYNEAALATLAANVAELQVLEPLIVRKVSQGDRFEIVAGERRWRAAQIAGLTAVPCIVRDLTDRQVCDIMISENLHREDMDPVQEAAVYAGLLKARDQDGRLIYPNIKDLTEVTGQRAKDIMAKIKILHCPSYLLEALSDGRVAVRVCELIGQIPTEADREKAARRALHCQFREGPMTVVEVREMLKNEFMTSLVGAPFDQNDSELVGEIQEDGVRVAGGACVDCPARTGNKPDLVELLAAGVSASGGRGGQSGISPQVCTRPACYREKLKRAWREEERQAELAGHRVMPAEAGLELLAGWNADLGVYVSNKVRYIDRYDRPGHGHTGHFGNDALPTWDELLTGERISWILVREGRKRRYFLESEIAVETVDLLRARRGEESLFARKAAAPKVAPVPREVEPEELTLTPLPSEAEILRKFPQLAPAAPVAPVEEAGDCSELEEGTDEEEILRQLPAWAATVRAHHVEGLTWELAVMALTTVLNAMSTEGRYLVWEIFRADPDSSIPELVEMISQNQPTRVVEAALATVLMCERVVQGEVDLVEAPEPEPSFFDGPVVRDPVICGIEDCEGELDDEGLCPDCGYDHSAQPDLYHNGKEGAEG